MFRSERQSPPAATLPPPAAGPAAGIASTPDEALPMPAAPLSDPPPDEDASQARRQGEIGPRECRWIIADEDAGAEALMCGAPAAPRRPFCAAHCRRAFMTLERDGEEAEAVAGEILEAEDVDDEVVEREAAE